MLWDRYPNDLNDRWFLCFQKSLTVLCGVREIDRMGLHSRNSAHWDQHGWESGGRKCKRTVRTLCTSIAITAREPGLRSLNGTRASYSGVPNSCTVPRFRLSAKDTEERGGVTFSEESNYLWWTLECVQHDCNPPVPWLPQMRDGLNTYK